LIWNEPADDRQDRRRQEEQAGRQEHLAGPEVAPHHVVLARERPPVLGVLLEHQQDEVDRIAPMTNPGRNSTWSTKKRGMIASVGNSPPNDERRQPRPDERHRQQRRIEIRAPVPDSRSSGSE
jgi:hypothetical protein